MKRILISVVISLAIGAFVGFSIGRGTAPKPRETRKVAVDCYDANGNFVPDKFFAAHGGVRTSCAPGETSKAPIPMLAPDGTVRDVPQDKVVAALANGGRMVTRMIDSHGTVQWVPNDQVAAALANGGTLVNNEKPGT